MSELLLTCQSEYDEDSKYVWVLSQDTRSIHAHVSPAELLNVPSNQLIEGRAPCSGHTWSSCAEVSITVKLNDMWRTTHYLPYLECLTNNVSEDEVPASDEGPEFSNRYVAIEVRWASFGHAGAELGVAQTSQDWGDGSDEEGEDDGRSRAVPGNGAGQHVHPGTQRAADAQRHQVERVKASREVWILGVTVYDLHPQELLPNAF